MSGDDAVPRIPLGVLQRLTELQEALGWLSDQTLASLSATENVPLSALEAVASFYPRYRRTPPPRCSISICRDAPCAIRGAAALTESTRRRLASRTDVDVAEVSCLGRCDAAPVAALDGVPIGFATDHRLEAIALGTTPVPSAEPVSSGRPFSTDPYGPGERRYDVLRRVLAGGASAIEAIPRLLATSGLVEKGSAGTPVGATWELVRTAPGRPKFVVCNAGASEPGAFEDRVLLVELPHLLLEGMLLACRVVDATTAIIHLRHDYAPERRSLVRAIADATREGALEAAGVASLSIFTSPGGYILGEETALLEALEGRRAEPRDPSPVADVRRLYGRPTLMTSVEAFAHVPRILTDGPLTWRARGKNGGSGLTFVSLAGDVATPGVYEVPSGTTVRELVDVHGGGGVDGRRLVGFVPGGASSAMLPASKLDTPLTFDAMKAAGSSLGRGAVMALAEGRDVLAVAADAVRFFRNESCGKCVPCRVGSAKAVEILDRAVADTSGPPALEALAALHESMSLASICTLGRVALVPAISVLENFPERLRPKPRRDRASPT